EYTIKEIAAYEGPITIYNENKELSVSFKAANTIFVEPLIRESEEN
ncbi:TPA: metal-dependent transcriptional regulator, partial [Enterococcus faecalis]